MCFRTPRSLIPDLRGKARQPPPRLRAAKRSVPAALVPPATRPSGCEATLGRSGGQLADRTAREMFARAQCPARGRSSIGAHDGRVRASQRASDARAVNYGPSAVAGWRRRMTRRIASAPGHGRAICWSDPGFTEGPVEVRRCWGHQSSSDHQLSLRDQKHRGSGLTLRS